MKEEYKAYLVSVLIGGIVGILVGYFSDTIFFSLSYNFHASMLAFSVVTPILVIILSFILSKKFPIASKKVRTRLYCIIILLIMYMLIVVLILYTLPYFPDIFAQIYKVPMVFFFSILYGIVYVFFTFLYSNILTIVAVYFATAGIENQTKRIILAFALAYLICLAAALPIIILTHV